jgi:hypothetical protein
MLKSLINLVGIGAFSKLRDKSIAQGSRFLMLLKGIRISMRNTKRQEKIES